MRKILFRLMMIFFCIIYVHQAANAAWVTKRLTWNSGGSTYPEIAVGPSGHIHVVWFDDSPGNDEIYFKKSTDGGLTWTGAKRLTWSSDLSLYPTVAVDPGNNIHVVWADKTPGNFEVFYKKSTDGGTGWITKRMTWNSSNSSGPTVRVDLGGNIHVFFNDDTPGNAELFHKKSTDGGVNWTTKRITWNSGNSGNPDGFFDSSGHLHLVWYDNTPGNTEIFYKKSTNGGLTWVVTKRLSWNSGTSGQPRVTADGSGNVHAVWQDYSPGHNEIYYAHSTDGGASWTSKRMTWSDQSMNPAILIDTIGHVHVFWSQGAMMGEIYFSTSMDDGKTWSGAKRLTWNSGASSSPEAAVDSGGNVHLVWHDSTPGNFDIYYKQKK